MRTQKGICMGFIMVRKLIDLLDDGYHNHDIANLTKISNELFEEMSPTNQQKAREWCEKKEKESREE